MRSPRLPDEQARVLIDEQLTRSGWYVCDRKDIDIVNYRGELINRDKTNLDLIWLKDDSLVDAADLPTPAVLAREIMEELQVALGEFEANTHGNTCTDCTKVSTAKILTG